MRSASEVHPLVHELVTRFGTFLHDPPAHNPYTRKERAGWFGCSDLSHKPPTVTYDPSRMIRQYLGLPAAQEFDVESAFAIGFGTFFDMACGQAMEASPYFESTQCCLIDETLRLRGTPDFKLDCFGDEIYGDVKTARYSAWQHYADPNYDLSRSYFWRQLQAYLMLSGTDRGVLIAFNRDGLPGQWDATLADRFVVREFDRDEVCIAGIRKDLTRLNQYLDRALPVKDDPEALEAVLLPLAA